MLRHHLPEHHTQTTGHIGLVLHWTEMRRFPTDTNLTTSCGSCNFAANGSSDAGARHRRLGTGIGCRFAATAGSNLSRTTAYAPFYHRLLVPYRCNYPATNGRMLRYMPKSATRPPKRMIREADKAFDADVRHLLEWTTVGFKYQLPTTVGSNYEDADQYDTRLYEFMVLNNI